jgi:hypothetical protein
MPGIEGVGVRIGAEGAVAARNSSILTKKGHVDEAFVGPGQ